MCVLFECGSVDTADTIYFLFNLLVLQIYILGLILLSFE